MILLGEVDRHLIFTEGRQESPTFSKSIFIALGHRRFFMLMVFRKKIICTFVFLLICCSALSQPLFLVKRLPNWGREYLTVINTFEFVDSKGNRVDCLSTSVGDIRLYDVISEINGHDTKGMGEEEFYEILSESKTCSLRVLRRIGSSIRDINNVQVSAIENDSFMGYDLWPVVYPNLLIQEKFVHDINDDCYMSSVRYTEVKKEFEAVDVIGDRNFDWFRVKKYDILPRPEDPLTDIVLLDDVFVENLSLSKAAYSKNLSYSFIKDEEEPDIVITLSKNARQSITTTYVPPSYTVVNTKSVSTPRYSYYKNQFLGYSTQHKNEVIKSGDYNVTNIDADVFLEITILDGHKMLRDDQRYPPVVWKGTFEKHFFEAVKKNEVTKNETQNLAKRLQVRPPLAKNIIHIYYTGLSREWVPDKTGKKDSGYYLIKGISESHPLYALGVRTGDIRKSDGCFYRDGEIVVINPPEDAWNLWVELEAINFEIDIKNKK